MLLTPRLLRLLQAIKEEEPAKPGELVFYEALMMYRKWQGRLAEAIHQQKGRR